MTKSSIEKIYRANALLRTATEDFIRAIEPVIERWDGIFDKEEMLDIFGMGGATEDAINSIFDEEEAYTDLGLAIKEKIISEGLVLPEEQDAA